MNISEMALRLLLYYYIVLTVHLNYEISVFLKIKIQP